MTTISESRRLVAIDALRGLVIVLMALDHVRDFWAPTPFDPTDLAQTSPAWFFTRWVTHLCAPTFVFLAGVSAYFHGAHVRTTGELSRFLWTRGLWLVFLELTVVNSSWTFFGLGPGLFAQVIWALGWSMVVLAGLVYLPRPWVGLVALALIVGHNLFDDVTPASFGVLGGLWNVLHVPGWIPFGEGGFGIYIAYPLIPWVGVMAMGYVVAPWLASWGTHYPMRLAAAGLALLAVFVALRWPNAYGDAALWATQPRGAVYSFMSFMNLTKYPPSLLYLCATLGISLGVLALFARSPASTLSVLVVFGRVPMFFYLLHVALIHALSELNSGLRYGAYNWYLKGPQAAPPGYEPSLPLAYGVWLAVLVMLYFACRWYGDLKQRRSDWWLKYL